MPKNLDFSFSKLSLQFKEPFLETEYANFTLNRTLGNPYVFLVLIFIVQGFLFPLSFVYNYLLLSILQVLTLFTTVLLTIFHKEIRRFIQICIFFTSCLSLTMAWIDLGVHYDELTQMELYFHIYLITIVQQILLQWYPYLRFAILYQTLNLIIRFSIFLSAHMETGEVAGIIGTILIDLVFLYSVHMREWSERHAFLGLWKNKNLEAPVQTFVTKYMQHSLVIVKEDLQTDLFLNENFKKNFFEDGTPDIKTQHILSAFSVSKNDCKSQSGLHSLFEEDQNMPLDEFIQKAIQEEKFKDQETISLISSRFLQLLDKQQFFEVSICKMDWDQQTPAICLVLNDITFLKEKLSQKITNAKQNQIMRTISHELKNPIHGILVMLTYGLRNFKDPDVISVLDSCQKNVFLLMKLVNSIIDLQLIRTNKLKLKFSTFNLEELLNEVLLLFEIHCKEKKITLEYEISKKIPKQISTDKERLCQILVHLLANAIKFTFNGGIKLKIDWHPTEKDSLHFSIEDTGIGMTKDDLTKLFSMNREIEDDKDQSDSHGVGFGLTFSNDLVRLLNGNNKAKGIDCVSEHQKGSTFSFSVVIDKVQPEQKDSLESEVSAYLEQIEDNVESKLSPYLVKTPLPSANGRKGSANCSIVSNGFENEDNFLLDLDKIQSGRRSMSVGTTSNQLSFSHRTNNRLISIVVTPPDYKSVSETFERLLGWILIVDDNPLNLVAAKKILGDKGCQIKTAINGRDAITKVLEHQKSGAEFFKMILMDCQMPVMDGYDTTQVLRDMMAKGEIPHCRIVALTANDSEEDVQKCLNSGMDEVFSKPLKEENIKKIKTLMMRS